MAGYGKIPYSELAIYASVQGYRGAELREFVDELQWVDGIFNEVERAYVEERSKQKKAENTAPVRPPNAKEQAQNREARRVRIRPPINGVKK
jgi:hypothetical protein